MHGLFVTRRCALRYGARVHVQDTFESVSDEIFYLPNLSNTTAGRQSVLDYLMLTRQATVVVNRNTEIGYDAFTRWPGPDGGAGPTVVTGQNSVRLLDILHLSEHGERGTAASMAGSEEEAAAEELDVTGWEVRSVPLHDKMHRRLVASEHLRTLMQTRWSVGGAGDTRFLVLPPPVDPSRFSEALARTPLLDAARPTVMFLGRLDAQKDPLTWLAVACLVQRDVPNARFRMLGDGPMRATVDHVLWLAEHTTAAAAQGDGGGTDTQPDMADDEAAAAAATGVKRYPDHVRQAVLSGACDVSAISIEGAVAHAETAARLSEAHVLLLTSAFEGTPIVILEALCLGVPVVAPAVGGIADILQARV
jgi:glycosyltransferase involved in cell wall biosynthesis